ncbi:MAG: DUF1573 domain-containing protein [Bacteroidota bacterium]|nr:DUF1573 domain-containing protein [Bacteroidota bacterium]
MMLSYLSTLIWVIFSCVSSKPVTVQRQNDSQERILSETSTNFPKIVFDSTSYHFGSTKKGGIISRELYFKNVGKADLVISQISACECTTLDWPRLPIKPGKTGKLSVKYNSKDKEGLQTVDVDIIANTLPELTVLKFTVRVFK